MALSRLGTSLSLEQLRDNVEQGPDMDFEIIELRSISYRIHAGFLFLEKEKNTLRTFCRSVGKTDVNKPYSNWKEFADCLGLKMDDVNHIDLYFKNQEGPVLVVLAAYVQKNSATLEKVINALKDTGRLDTINLISDGVRELVNRVADYPHFIDANSGIYRPTTLPWVPFVLQLPSDKSNSTINTIDEIINNATRFLVQDGNGIMKSINRNTPLKARVMLTFANDGVEAADRIANKLRSYDFGIGVLILKEQRDHYFAKTREFITDCIEQVDTIIPILTKGYYETIRGRGTAVHEQLGACAPDQQYAKYIYSFFSLEFVMNKCQHKRVRCIVPNGENYDPYWRAIELEIWFPESAMNEFVEYCILPKKTME